MREGTTSRVTVADRPYGEFYDFYSVSPENFGSTVLCAWSCCLGILTVNGSSFITFILITDTTVVGLVNHLKWC